MSILVESVRTRPRATATASRPSVREVCLLGMRTPAPLTAGEHVTHFGRIYRIEATRARSDRDGADPSARYVHLAPG